MQPGGFGMHVAFAPDAALTPSPNVRTMLKRGSYIKELYTPVRIAEPRMQSAEEASAA